MHGTRQLRGPRMQVVHAHTLVTAGYETASVVLHKDVDPILDPCDLNGQGGGTCVFERVTDGLLYDMEGGDLDLFCVPTLQAEENKLHLHGARHVHCIAQVAQRRL